MLFLQLPGPSLLQVLPQQPGAVGIGLLGQRVTARLLASLIPRALVLGGRLPLCGELQGIPSFSLGETCP